MLPLATAAVKQIELASQRFLLFLLLLMLMTDGFVCTDFDT